MKRASTLFLLLLLGSVFLHGAESSPQETANLAASLDELVMRHPPWHTENHRKGALLYAGAPVELTAIVRIAAPMLKINEAEFRELLEDDRQTLSRIVYARLLGAKRNTAWKPLLINGEDLLPALQREGVTLGEVHGVLENLYTELSFASLDSPVIPNEVVRKPRHK